MRLRSRSAVPNVPPIPEGKPASGGWKFPKIWPVSKGQKEPKMMSPNKDSPPVEREEPKKVVGFDQNLEQSLFYEAALQLVEKEKLLFGQSEEDKKVLKLASDHKILETLVIQTIKESLKGEQDAAVLASAVKAVQLQEEQDQLVAQMAGSAPSWRPSRWRQQHDQVLTSLVEERMENPSVSSSSPVKQNCLQAEIHSMGLQMKEDLLTVVKSVKSCYPPEMDICQFYAELYHQPMSKRLEEITEFGLGDEDCTFLLQWVTDFYPGMFKNPLLAPEINFEALGSLLPDHMVASMQEQFLSKQQTEMTTFISQVLAEARESWKSGGEPTKEDGCFTMSYDIIQLINGMLTSAEMVVGDREKVQSITCELSDSLCSFKDFQEDVMKQNKGNSKPFIKANLGCIQQFRDFILKKSSMILDDVRERCMGVLADMKQSAHQFLLSPVHQALKPNYRKLGTHDWLHSSMFDKMMDSLEREVESLQGSPESSHQELIGQLHQEVTAEYVRRLLKGDVKLRSRAQQQAAFDRVTSDADTLQRLFRDQGSKEDWLKELLDMIAGVLGLQDVPAIQMQVITLASLYPDVSEKHVSALLKLKTNISREDRQTVKSILNDTLREIKVSPAHVFFSKIIIPNSNKYCRLIP